MQRSRILFTLLSLHEIGLLQAGTEYNFKLNYGMEQTR